MRLREMGVQLGTVRAGRNRSDVGSRNLGLSIQGAECKEGLWRIPQTDSTHSCFLLTRCSGKGLEQLGNLPVDQKWELNGTRESSSQYFKCLFRGGPYWVLSLNYFMWSTTEPRMERIVIPVLQRRSSRTSCQAEWKAGQSESPTPTEWRWLCKGQVSSTHAKEQVHRLSWESTILFYISYAVKVL